GAGSFGACYSLTAVTIPASVTNIGDSAFARSEERRVGKEGGASRFYSSLDGDVFNKSQTTLVLFPPGKGGTYPIPGSVTNIGADAFYNCTRLTDVTIPGSVASFGYSAFSACTSVPNVSLRSGVSSSGAGSFGACYSLTAVTIPASVTNIGDSAFA